MIGMKGQYQRIGTGALTGFNALMSLLLLWCAISRVLHFGFSQDSQLLAFVMLLVALYYLGLFVGGYLSIRRGRMWGWPSVLLLAGLSAIPFLLLQVIVMIDRALH